MNKTLIAAILLGISGNIFAADNPAELNTLKAKDVQIAMSETSVPVPVAGKQHEADSVQLKGAIKTFTNNDGCKVQVEETRNGFLYFIQSSDRQQVSVGVLKNYKSGDISGFASNAAVSGGASGFIIEGDNSESGASSTRGRAELRFVNGGLSSVRVTGEVKKVMGWRTDTRIVCENLK